MSVTVAVALITSLSTLASAALTGTLTALVNSRQLRHQRQLAREQRTEDRAETVRQLRRDAYERLLGKADAAYRVLDDGWLATPFTEHPHWPAGFAARRALDEAAIRVLLEGPPEVAEQADALVRSVNGEFDRLRKLRVKAADGVRSLAELDRGERAKVLDERSRASAAFIAEARRALNEPTSQRHEPEQPVANRENPKEENRERVPRP